MTAQWAVRAATETEPSRPRTGVGETEPLMAPIPPKKSDTHLHIALFLYSKFSGLIVRQNRNGFDNFALHQIGGNRL